MFVSLDDGYMSIYTRQNSSYKLRLEHFTVHTSKKKKKTGKARMSQKIKITVATILETYANQ